MNRLRDWLKSVVYLSNNFISLIGVIMVTAATVLWIGVLPITMRSGTVHPYFGIAVFLLLPGVFIGGLLIIPVGIWWNRKSRIKQGHMPAEFPPLDAKNPELRRLIGFIGVTTILNVILASQFAYSAVNYMDSVTFCGQTCHTVMQPEFTAHQRSPHSRVECVSCHIGPGASWFVKSKLSGAGQVLAVMFNNYPRPIPQPVRNLRPARETCETCHWPQKFDEDRLRDLPSYAEDEQNSLTHTVLMLHLGGGANRVGIHGRHLGEGVAVRYYATDDKRENVPWVEYTSGGKTVVYAAAGAKLDPSKIRVMDCIDCHNRPTHIYELPERAMDNAMTAGQISATLPFAKKQGVAILKQTYAGRDEAAVQIPKAFEDYYKATYPQVYAQRADDIKKAGAAVATIYMNNVFPAMKVTWGTYNNNLGHTDSIGCFRCHDGSHNTTDGKEITQDCSACHNLLVSGEKSPKILVDLGLEQAPPPDKTADKKDEKKKK